MIKYPSIEQFRHTVENVKRKAQYTGRDENDYPLYDETLPLPVLKYRGTVKLHGTNASVSWLPDDTMHAQSRTRRITVGDDNAGFAKFVHEEVGRDKWVKMFDDIMVGEGEKIAWNERPPQRPVTIYGEWCGKGIMKSVAISELPHKIFVIFGIRVGYPDDEDRFWVDVKKHSTWLSSHDDRIYNVFEFPHYYVDVDFNNPRLAQKKMDQIVEAVENECPIGKALGISGTGEGVVWQPEDEGWESSDFRFKVKGSKHKISKTRTPKVLSPAETEKQDSIQEFIESTVTENRLEQGLESLKEMGHEITMRTMGEFIKWVSNDVVKEEYDVMKASGITQKEINKPISFKARNWYRLHLDKQAGL